MKGKSLKGFSIERFMKEEEGHPRVVRKLPPVLVFQSERSLLLHEG
jgi:hypothetical protein